MPVNDEIVAEAFAHDRTFALEDVCRICSVDAVRLLEYVEYEVVAPCDASGQRFDTAQLARVRRARRLQRDFELNTPGVALALQLLETVNRLEAELARLRQHVDS